MNLISELREGKVRIIGFVLEKNKYITLIDDSFGKVRVKTNVDVNVGDVIEVFGYYKNGIVYGNKVFKRDEKYYLYILFRYLNFLKKNKDKIEEKEEISINFNSVYDDLTKKVYEFIRNNPFCSIEDISNALKLSKKEVEEILMELMARGEIYEPYPNKFKII